MRRETANVLLVLVGGALVKITVDGTYLRYVKPSAGPWVLIAGIVVLGLAAVAIARDLVAGHAIEVHHHNARWAWLLMMPVLAIFLVAPPALGADSVLRAGNRSAPGITGQGITGQGITGQGAAAFPPLPKRAVVPIPVNEFIMRSVWDSSNSLRGRTVSLTGFVVHEDGTDYIARLVITCCAADATPMKVALTGHLAGELPDDQWIDVTGQLRAGSATVANGYTPTLTVSSLSTVTAPADPYEY